MVALLRCATQGETGGIVIVCYWGIRFPKRHILGEELLVVILGTGYPPTLPEADSVDKAEVQFIGFEIKSVLICVNPW